MRVFSCGGAADVKVPSAVAIAVRLVMRSNVRRFAENMSILPPYFAQASRSFPESPGFFFGSFLDLPRPRLDVASTLGFSHTMDRSGERLHSSGASGQMRRGGASANQAASIVSTGGPAAIGAELIASHYEARRWALASKTARPFIHLLCLHSGGAAEVYANGETIALCGPAIVWLPPGCAEYLN